MSYSVILSGHADAPAEGLIEVFDDFVRELRAVDPGDDPLSGSISGTDGDGVSFSRKADEVPALDDDGSEAIEDEPEAVGAPAEAADDDEDAALAAPEEGQED